MSEALEKYQEATKRLLEIRRENNDQESLAEDQHLDKMDHLWRNLSDEDKATLNRHR